MRLIDADKLKTHYAWWGDTENRKLFDAIVDVQPTVEPEKIMEWVIRSDEPYKGDKVCR